MKTSRQLFIFVAALLSTIGFSPAFGQGSLTPPGAPAPTMKTLAEIEPRTAITNLPITLTQGGSYYLTQSFTGVFTGSAIAIATNNVTLDLCGFTINQTGVGESSSVGVQVESSVVNLPLFNAHIMNGSLVGFTNAVLCLGARACVVENISANQGDNGVVFDGNGTATSTGNIIRHCVAGFNAGNGFAFMADTANNANQVTDCNSLNNGTGFDLASINNLIIHCCASSNSVDNYVIAVDNDMGTIAEPIQNTSAVAGSKGGSAGIGVTDPFSNLSYP